MRQVVVLLLLTVAGGTRARPQPQERECLASRKVLHTGRCYALLEQGPCAADSRLTLDVEALPRISATCTTCRCCDIPRAVWWPGDASCHRSRDEGQLCGEGSYLGEDLFGDGACLCKPGYARTPGEDSGSCYALYHRGPCHQGQVFIAVKAEDGGTPRCVDDPCADDNTSGNVTTAMAPDGRCYPLGSRGPCPEDSSFNVHPEMLRPQCIDRTNHIIQLPCMSKVSDVNGGCQDALQPEDDSSFGLALIRAAKNKSKSKSKSLNAT